MRGILALEDWVKLAAGLMAGIFVLSILWMTVSNFVSTQCWKDAMGPFNENILGSKSLQAPLGSKESFIVPINFNKDCTQGAYFLHGQFDCSAACQEGVNKGYVWDSKFKAGIVNTCKKDCTSYCENKDCILLMPLPQVAFDLNSPRVYGSGDYKFTWDSKLTWISGSAANRDMAIKPDSNVKCLVFTKSSDGKSYQVKPSSVSGDCK